ncbi:MAG: T9SS type A sorting domain-containing protein, partial [Bacteroidales bacterium]
FHIKGVGEVKVKVVQNGDRNYLKADDEEFSINIVKAIPKIILSDTIIKTIGDPAFEFSCKSTSDAPISFSVENGNCISVKGDLASIESIGEATVKAIQEANENYLSAERTFKVIVKKATQSITTEKHITKTFGDGDFVLNAYASSGLPLKYTRVFGDDVISNNENKITILNAGIAEILIKQEGTDDYYEETSTRVTIEVGRLAQKITPLDNITEYVNAKSIQLPSIIAQPSLLPVEIIAPKNNGVLSVTNNIVSIEQVGSVELQLLQVGTRNYLPATEYFTITIVDVMPDIIGSSSGFESFEGGSYCFDVEATGTNLIYQWYVDGRLIEGANSSVYCIDDLKSPDAGQYFVMVSNSAGSVTSSKATLIVHRLPDLGGLIKLYPNPTNGPVSLETPDILSLENITIRNEIGSFINSLPGNGGSFMQFDISNYPPGFYFVQIKTNKGTIVKRAMRIR